MKKQITSEVEGAMITRCRDWRLWARRKAAIAELNRRLRLAMLTGNNSIDI